MEKAFYEGLVEENIDKLLSVPKSDIHNHSSKGCRIAWLQDRLNCKLPKPPEKFGGLDGMHEWFSTEIKPYCKGADKLILRWEGAFAEAKRNNIKRLAMNFGVSDIELVGGLDFFKETIEAFHNEYCPNAIFEPELTYPSFCDVQMEADRIDEYIADGFFKSIDVCGGEDVQPFEAFLPLYKKAEKYNLTKIMHVGETGSAEDVRNAVDVLGLDEIHHGINAAASKEVMKFLADNQIQLNVCPSSNVMLGFAESYQAHPIKILYENGVKLTINTDDLLIFDSTIENEYLILYKAGALSAEALDDIRLNGLKLRGRVTD